MDGIVIVDKPEGVTSADVVRVAKRHLHVKVGHLGTLDPFATGVLPLCFGEGTKIAQFLNVADKTYAGSITLGAETDSGDRTGSFVRRAAVPDLSHAQLDALSERLLGEQLQTPPMYSAIKLGGVPLYKLARAGKEVERAPRRITIHALRLRRASPTTIEFEVHCSKGTYARVLGQDIAVALGTAGYLEALRRTAFGRFTLDDAGTVEDLKAGRVGTLIGLRAALSHLREITLVASSASRARSGHASVLQDLPAAAPDDAAKLVGPEGDLVAVVSATSDGRWRFERVFALGRG